MKKVLFVLLSVALFVACGGNKYTVSGKIEGLSDGDSVSICDISNGVSLVTLDSTVVKNGKFIFKGETDTCDVCVLVFNIDGEMNTCTFFLEPGKINITYKDNIQKVSGTRTNEGFQKFYDDVASLDDKATDLDSRMQKANQAGESMDSYKDEMDALQDMYKDIVETSIRDNADNPFGFQQMLDSYSMFEPEELDELLKLLEPAFGTHDYMQQLREMTDSQLKTAIGQQYQNFTAADADSNDVSLADCVAANKLVLLDFWASWCGPCRNEIPYMKEAYEKFHSQGFEIVSVSVDENMDEWKKALEEEGMTWPQLHDAQTGEGSPAYMYAVTVIPTSFLIDADGTIIGHNLRGEEYDEVLSDYFGK